MLRALHGVLKTTTVLGQPYESNQGRYHYRDQSIKNDAAGDFPIRSTGLREGPGVVPPLNVSIPPRDRLRGEMIGRSRGIRPLVDLRSFRESVHRILGVLASYSRGIGVRYETRFVVPQYELAEEGPRLQKSGVMSNET